MFGAWNGVHGIIVAYEIIGVKWLDTDLLKIVAHGQISISTKMGEIRKWGGATLKSL